MTTQAQPLVKKPSPSYSSQFQHVAFFIHGNESTTHHGSELGCCKYRPSAICATNGDMSWFVWVERGFHTPFIATEKVSSRSCHFRAPKLFPALLAALSQAIDTPCRVWRPGTVMTSSIGSRFLQGTGMGRGWIGFSAQILEFWEDPNWLSIACLFWLFLDHFGRDWVSKLETKAWETIPKSAGTNNT